MASRNDQLQAYQFMTQRVISALVMRETDPRQSPLRRGVGAVFGGLMVAILVGAGFGIYGILTKVGGDQWKTSGSVVIEKETGASFVYLDGTLYPTLNLTSAMLAAGQPNPQVFRVASGSLGSVPRGLTVGIPGAPASLPGADKRVGLPWTVCAIPTKDGAGRAKSTVGLAVSLAPSGGRGLTNEGVLVKDDSVGTTYLIWHGRRHQVQSSRTLVPALFGAATPTPVGTAWLNTLTPGGDIAPISVPNRGNDSGAVKGRQIGNILIAQTGSGPQLYVVFDDGLAPITELQRYILGADTAVTPIQVDLSVVNAAARSARLVPADGLALPPASTPPLAAPSGTEELCVVTGSGSSAAVWVGGAVPGLDRAPPTASTSPAGAALADRVLVPAGRVAVIRVLSAPTAESGAYFVLTDVGIKYPVASAAVLPMLGYSSTQAADVPASLALRIPTGPTLDPAAAAVPVRING